MYPSRICGMMALSLAFCGETYFAFVSVRYMAASTAEERTTDAPTRDARHAVMNSRRPLCAGGWRS